MTERLFSNTRHTNPNAEIMIVEQEEGGTNDDTYFGSIGDATARHIQELDGFGIQMWRELIVMPNGEMYKMVPNWEENDCDPNNLRGRDLNQYVSRFKGKVSESMMNAIMEAVDNEKERRELEEDEESEDALDQEWGSFEDWERNPTKFEKEDLPATPRDRAVYMGDTRQVFYDEFPVGHPDSKIIGQVLNMLNREWDIGVDSSYAEWIGKYLDDTKVRPYVRKYLKHLAYSIAEDNCKADDYAREALLNIDSCWAIECKNQAAKRAMKNSMLHLILKKEKEWAKMHKEGFSVQSAIKRFGQLLFTDFRDRMNGYLWARYRRARDMYAPRVMLKGVDINRCTISELEAVLRVDKKTAEKVWFARPFSSLEAAYLDGHVSATCFANDEKTDKVVLFVEEHAKIACKNKDVRRMNDVCKVLLKMQKEKHGDLRSNQWSTIWRYYNILKAQVLAAVNDKGE